MRLRVLIIDAGTGRMCLAHGLRRASIEVAVFERDRIGGTGCRAPGLVSTLMAAGRCMRACPAFFDDDSSAIGDVLVGADGSNSPTRTAASRSMSAPRVPIPQWPTTTTLIGDAIHTMTPDLGRWEHRTTDAQLLCTNLTAARDGTSRLLAGSRDYKTQMIKYGTEAVKKSLRQMSGSDPIHTPVLGRVVLAGMRTGMRLAPTPAPLKNRMTASQQTL